MTRWLCILLAPLLALLQVSHCPASEPVHSPSKNSPHWAFQPIRRPQLPPVRKKAAVRNEIDQFIAARLEAEGLEISPEADRRTLIRRLHLDMLGLLPDPDRVERFIRDRDPRAYEKEVDAVLASPRYGERWARHWLDVVRFAESHGFEMNQARPNAWPYRDYVIRALNEDKPYDQFVLDQLAGDARGEDAATGFLVGGPWDQVKSPDPGLTAQQRMDELHDMVATTGSAFLGLTVGCARCHNHKFDPITQVDYYSFQAMFAGVQHGEHPLRTPGDPADRKREHDLRRQIAEIESRLENSEVAARPQAIRFLDDEETSDVEWLQPADGAENYPAGRERGSLDDPGLNGVPNVSRSFHWWKAPGGEWLARWKPKVSGDFRVWISWAAAAGNNPEVEYWIDSDGDPATGADRTRLVAVDTSRLANGDPAPQPGSRWSGFKIAGDIRFTETAAIFLKAAGKGRVTADALLLEPNSPSVAKAAVPHFRGPVQFAKNVDRFEPVETRRLRFSIFKTTGEAPCIDELEVFTPGANPRNVALASSGTRVAVSGSLAGFDIHRPEHLNDGRYGNSRSWISDRNGSGVVDLTFPGAVRIDRVVWSRDREPSAMPFRDRLATGYRIEVQDEAGGWRTVASSLDRLPFGSPPIVVRDPETRKTWAGDLPALAALKAELGGMARTAMVYGGKFETPPLSYRLHRGDPLQPRELVVPATLSKFKPSTLATNASDLERRLALGRWIVDPENPLTARVIANRLWQHHFGEGLAATPSDFGVNGLRPSHPELLDWLASELLANGWSLKSIHRKILLSATYRQSSASNARGVAADAGSRLLWRFPPRRLEAEVIRDLILQASGNLDLRMGGPGFDLFEPNANYVKVYQPRETFGPEEWRRMIYQSKPRMQLDPIFGSFDCPDAGQIAPKRNASTTALQALNLLNSPFIAQQSELLAARLQQAAGSDPNAQVRRAFAWMFQREPDADELARAADVLRNHGSPMFCRALFNVTEFIRME